MNKGLVIIGTDTDIGKTFVSAALLSALRRRGIDTGYMKPLQSGAFRKEGILRAPDVEYILEKTGKELEPGEYEEVSPVRLELPLAPAVAARLREKEIDLSRVLTSYQRLQEKHKCLLVEGVGGLMVPIAKNTLLPELIKSLNLPVLVVTGPGLGTINHTLLTVKIAGRLGIEVSGIIINNYPVEPDIATRTNPDVISRFLNADILGIIPRFENETLVDNWEEIVDIVEEKVNISRVIKAASLGGKRNGH